MKRHKYTYRSFLFLLFIPLILLGQVNTEKYRSEADTTGFGLKSEINIKIQKGNVDFQEISIESLAQYLFTSSRIIFVISGDLGWESGQRFSNTMLAHLRYVQNFSRLWQLELFSQLDYNKSRLLNGRLISGAGTRLQLWQDANDGFWLGNSFFYERETYDLSGNTVHKKEISDIRFSTYLSIIKSLQKYITLNSVMYYQPRLSNWDDFKIMTESGLVFKITNQIAMSFKFIYRFDNKPPDGIKKEDISILNGLIVNF